MNATGQDLEQPNMITAVLFNRARFSSGKRRWDGAALGQDHAQRRERTHREIEIGVPNFFP